MRSLIIGIILLITVIVIGVGLGRYTKNIVEKQDNRIETYKELKEKM